MRTPRRILPNAAMILSFLLLAVTGTCWVAGAVREKQTTVWRLKLRTERAFFVRIERQHLIVSEQQMVPVRLPDGYAMDCTLFREFRVTGPLFPQGIGTELHPDYFALNPTGSWFRKISVRPGGVKMLRDESGAINWQALTSYTAVEIPWWSLLLLFSLRPALNGLARLQRRAKRRRGLCPSCGYDLRATPDRCPECGEAAGALTAG